MHQARSACVRGRRDRFRAVRRRGPPDPLRPDRRDRQSLGIVAGVIDGQGRRIVAHGDVKADSLFEIGSITKVFTALLLADMVERGEVALHDPVSKYLPEGVKVAAAGAASDYARGPGDAHVGPAARADESLAEESPESLRGIHRPSGCTTFSAVHLAARARVEVGIFQPRRGASRARSLAPRGHRLRNARPPADLRSARHDEHVDERAAGDEIARRQRDTTGRSSRSGIGISMSSPGPARSGRTPGTCWSSLPRISGKRSPGWRRRWRRC